MRASTTTAASPLLARTRRAGIHGATGITGVELAGLLDAHPALELAWATSRRHAGTTLDTVDGSAPTVELRAPEDADDDVDIVFLCLPHGRSAAAASRHRSAGTRVVDLSGDLRLRDADAHARAYNTERPTEVASEAVYGLTELTRDRVAGARLVANPGCYPTCVGLALAPLAVEGRLRGTIVVDAKSGVSGAGREPTAKTHYCSASGDVRPYAVGRRHRHVPEIEQLLRDVGVDDLARVIFTPHLVPLERGMLATCVVTDAGGDADEIRDLYRELYAGEPFVRVAGPDAAARIRSVVRTNGAVVSVHEVEDTDAVVIVSAIDNLLKGAAGQAVQNANLMLGLPEVTGLPGARASEAAPARRLIAARSS